MQNTETKENETLLAIGTAYVQGEDVAARGRVLLFSLGKNTDNNQPLVNLGTAFFFQNVSIYFSSSILIYFYVFFWALLNLQLLYTGFRGLLKRTERCYICLGLTSRSSINSVWSKNYSAQVDWCWVEWYCLLWCSTITCCELKYCKWYFLKSSVIVNKIVNSWSVFQTLVVCIYLQSAHVCLCWINFQLINLFLSIPLDVQYKKFYNLERDLQRKNSDNRMSSIAYF